MPAGLILGRTASGVSLREAGDADKRGDIDGAIKLYEEALAADECNAAAHNAIGALYYRKGDIDAAQRHFARSVALRPGFPRALTNLGACHNEQGRHQQAIACYEKAIMADPRFVDAYRNMGKAWGDMDEYEMAVWSYRKAYELAPNSESARGLAKNYRRTGRYRRARQILAKAIEADPVNADLQFNMAMTEFHLDNWASGLKAYEWRFQLKEMQKHRSDLAAIFNRPWLKGAELKDQTLLLHTEQGFGDSLQFARFVRLVRAKVGRLVMFCRPGLGRLFSHCLELDEVSEKLDALPEFNYHLPLLSVPSRFDPHLSSLRPFSPYLSAPPRLACPLQPEEGCLNVGLVWGASDSGFDHRNKKVPLLALDPLLANKAVKWFSLQVGSDRRDLAIHGYETRVVDVGAKLTDFARTAAAVDALDLVITCDTSVAHLAGAMGRPVWVMLKKEPDWRWHADGERSTWYPSARLYRQYSHGDWSDVVRRVLLDLDSLVAERGLSPGR